MDFAYEYFKNNLHIGPTLHYRGASTLQPPRTFRGSSSNSNVAAVKQMKLFDHNHNIYGTNKRKSHHYAGGGGHATATNHHYNMLDDICEFQVNVKIDFTMLHSKICNSAHLLDSSSSEELVVISRDILLLITVLWSNYQNFFRGIFFFILCQANRKNAFALQQYIICAMFHDFLKH